MNSMPARLVVAGGWRVAGGWHWGGGALLTSSRSRRRSIRTSAQPPDSSGQLRESTRTVSTPCVRPHGVALRTRGERRPAARRLIAACVTAHMCSRSSPARSTAASTRRASTISPRAPRSSGRGRRAAEPDPSRAAGTAASARCAVSPDSHMSRSVPWPTVGRTVGRAVRGKNKLFCAIFGIILYLGIVLGGSEYNISASDVWTCCR